MTLLKLPAVAKMKKSDRNRMENSRAYREEEIILEAGDREIISVTLAEGVTVRGHWYEDHMLTALGRGAYFRKKGEGRYEEIVI